MSRMEGGKVMERKRKMNVKMIVEGGVMIALAMILSYIKIYELPNGGSVTAASMVPIMIFAYRWGVKQGILVGAVYGVLQFILGPKYSMHWVSIILDYVAGFGVLGFAGAFGKGPVRGIIGVTFASFLRLICSTISGVVVFASYAPAGQDPLIYSIAYNSSYMVPEFIVSAVVFGIIVKSAKNVIEKK
jgi:thiamine transporter